MAKKDHTSIPIYIPDADAEYFRLLNMSRGWISDVCVTVLQAARKHLESLAVPVGFEPSTEPALRKFIKDRFEAPTPTPKPKRVKKGPTTEPVPMQ